MLFCDELVHTLEAIAAAIDAGIVQQRILVVGKRYNYQMPEVLPLDGEVTPCCRRPVWLGSYQRWVTFKSPVTDHLL